MSQPSSFLQEDLLRLQQEALTSSLSSLQRRISSQSSTTLSRATSNGSSSLSAFSAGAGSETFASQSAFRPTSIGGDLLGTSQLILQNSRLIERALQAREAEARIAAATQAVRQAEEQVVAARLARAQAVAKRPSVPTSAPCALLAPRLNVDSPINASPLLRAISEEQQQAASKATMLATLQDTAAARQQRLTSALAAHRVTVKDVMAKAALPCFTSSREPSPAVRLSPAQKPQVHHDLKIQETKVSHQPEKSFIPLAIEQDRNWLSECQCMLRSDFIEIFQATRKEFNGATGESTEYNQVGIRCRFCAHLPSGKRTSRSSAFPSSIKQLYQSFTMMQRDHFQKCHAVPPEKKQRLEELRKTNTQGACDSKQYWIYAAQTMGMFDTHRGIEITRESVQAGSKMPFYGVNQDEVAPGIKQDAGPLVQPSDAQRTHPFLYTLLKQLVVVELLPSEQTGKRKSLPIGFCGLGCRYCCQKGRLGFSRTFPLRRKTLPAKLDDIFTHMLRCPTCPKEVKTQLATLSMDGRRHAYQNPEVMDRIWEQLGRDGDVSV